MAPEHGIGVKNVEHSASRVVGSMRSCSRLLFKLVGPWFFFTNLHIIQLLFVILFIFCFYILNVWGQEEGGRDAQRKEMK